MAGTSDDGITPSVFRLLCDEYALFLRRTGSSKPFADRLVEKYLEEGERDRDGRIRYKILEVHALPGGLTPSPYDGDFCDAAGVVDGTDGVASDDSGDKGCVEPVSDSSDCVRSCSPALSKNSRTMSWFNRIPMTL